jgi:outer membrane receptor protein involved in Fe transport
MAALNTDGALSGGASSSVGGRAADLRELPAAMIKTIDVYKGTTAAMTEGSLGGSVKIETRSGLDFDTPFFQVTADGQGNTVTARVSEDERIFIHIICFLGKDKDIMSAL